MAKLPEGWIVADLGEFCEGIRGVTYKPDDLAQVNTEKTITLLRSNNIKAGALNFKDVQHVAQKNVNQKQVAQLGDIAVCMSNGSKRLVGKSAAFKYIPEERRYTVGSFCSIFRPLESACPVFVEQVFCSDQFQKQVDFSLAGSAINNLKNSDLIAYQFLKPPLPEQQKIATILSSVDEVIEKTRAQIDKLKDLKTGMMQELLTKGIGHTEFKDSPVGRIPTSWKVIPLEELCSKVSVGIASSTTHAYCSSGVPLLRNQNILPSGIRRTDILYISQKFSEENSSKKIHTGDVITVRTGYPGISAVVPEEFNNCHSFTTLISRPKPAVLNSHYLSLLINSDYGKNFVVGGQAGGAQQNLNATTLKIFPVILPPLREQVAIFEIVNSVSEKISLSIKKLVAMNSVKKALMQDLLTGKVRVNLTDKESAVV